MEDWTQMRGRIAAEVTRLADGEFVSFTLPQPPAAASPRRGLFRRRAAEPSRYVQFLRDGDWLVCECPGSTSFGGDLALDDEAERRLRDAGWRTPGDPEDEPWGYPNHRVRLTVDAVDEAARLAVEALAALGGRPHDEYAVERGR